MNEYITAAFHCIIYTATCFDILCLHQGFAHPLLAKLHKFLDASVECYKITINKTLKYCIIIGAWDGVVVKALRY